MILAFTLLRPGQVGRRGNFRFRFHGSRVLGSILSALAQPRS